MASILAVQSLLLLDQRNLQGLRREAVLEKILEDEILTVIFTSAICASNEQYFNLNLLSVLHKKRALCIYGGVLHQDGGPPPPLTTAQLCISHLAYCLH